MILAQIPADLFSGVFLAIFVLAYLPIILFLAALFSIARGLHEIAQALGYDRRSTSVAQALTIIASSVQATGEQETDR